MRVIGLRNAPKPLDLWVTPAGWPAPIRMGMPSPARTSTAEPWSAMPSKASLSTPFFATAPTATSPLPSNRGRWTSWGLGPLLTRNHTSQGRQGERLDEPPLMTGSRCTLLTKTVPPPRLGGGVARFPCRDGLNA